MVRRLVWLEGRKDYNSMLCSGTMFDKTIPCHNLAMRSYLKNSHLCGEVCEKQSISSMPRLLFNAFCKIVKKKERDEWFYK